MSHQKDGDGPSDLPSAKGYTRVENLRGMGLFHVPARLTGPTGRSEDRQLLVDTRATFLVVPRSLAERLELRPTRICPLQIAGGREET